MKKVIYTKIEIEAFRKFAHKGPVRHATSQRAASRYYCTIERYLDPDEKTKLSIARGHAVDQNEGRYEFDVVMNAVLKRVGLK